MNLSQCSSSGCESGWTSYLDQSSVSRNKHCHSFKKGAKVEYQQYEDEEEEEDLDLSMVSDASSGPTRYYCQDCFEENCSCFRSPSATSELVKKSNKKKNKKKIKESYCRNQQQHSYLDDTASSHVLGFSEKNSTFSNNEASMEDFSQGFSATHLKGKSTFKKHFSFSGERGDFQGRKWK